MNTKAIVCLLTLMLSLFAPSLAETTDRMLMSADDPWIEQTLKSMMLEEKIGQMFVPTTVSAFMNQESESFQELKKNELQFEWLSLKADAQATIYDKSNSFKID